MPVACKLVEVDGLRCRLELMEPGGNGLSALLSSVRVRIRLDTRGVDGH